jgi:hypothetical protein
MAVLPCDGPGAQARRLYPDHVSVAELTLGQRKKWRPRQGRYSPHVRDCNRGTPLKRPRIGRWLVAIEWS